MGPIRRDAVQFTFMRHFLSVSQSSIGPSSLPFLWCWQAGRVVYVCACTYAVSPAFCFILYHMYEVIVGTTGDTLSVTEADQGEDYYIQIYIFFVVVSQLLCV